MRLTQLPVILSSVARFRAPAPESSVASLVSAQWLQDRLEEPSLRIFDVTQKLDRVQNDAAADEAGYAAGHIPGAAFLDAASLSLQGIRNERGDELHNMACGAEQFAGALSAAGVDDTNHVVLYSSRHVMWATRIWWLLHSFGFEGRVSVLDGGLAAWVRAGGELETMASQYPPAVGPPPRTARAGALVGKVDVLRALPDEEVVLVDSLKAASFNGSKSSRYGRQGHITGATNVPYETVVDGDSGLFKDELTIRDAFLAAGVPLQGERRQILAY